MFYLNDFLSILISRLIVDCLNKFRNLSVSNLSYVCKIFLSSNIYFSCFRISISSFEDLIVFINSFSRFQCATSSSLFEESSDSSFSISFNLSSVGFSLSSFLAKVLRILLIEIKENLLNNNS